ncbi:mechanosensitive ion channel domain-containing protein [Phycisphaera mikurensis]|uniref:Putative MscS family protein n=1 Tax=Phycisphaera mikurensis (strain NBRC 102666 / KCTC 22515 / FYK2301M01) TaxID=1142394 RepID=I0ID79_PHYMF|nr:mechanosensitive ion channel domain-containing protein [Phycisphaera mikurensis]MBB6442342.1 potassium efflux system protein [Phycisphaera mikurensis]BAM03217.1 putative MscS family protein [Phycisphaera mikurensis NBRC 102666]
MRRSRPRPRRHAACLLLLLLSAALPTAPAVDAAGQLPGFEAASAPTPSSDAATPAPDLAEEQASAEAARAASEARTDADVAFAASARGTLLPEAEAELAAAREAAPPLDRAAVAALAPGELRAALEDYEAEAATLRASVVSTRAEADRLTRRLEGLAAETEAAREAVDDAERLLAEAEEGPARSLREAQLQAAQAELEQLVGLATSLPLRERLSRLKLETLEVRSARLQRTLDLLNARDAALRQAEAEAQAQAARQAAADAGDLPQAVRRLAERLVELAERQQKIEEEAAAYAGKAGKVAEDAALYRDQLASARERVEFGMTEAVGVQFQARQRELENPAGLAKRVRALQERRAEYATTLLDLADDKRNLGTRIAAAREALGPAAGAAALRRLDELAAAYGRLLDATSAAADRAQSDVVDLLAAEQNRLDALRDYRDFLDERLLWTPNLGRLGLGDLPRASSAAWQWWTRLDPADAVETAGRRLVPPPAIEAVLFLLGLVLLIVRSRLRRLLSELGEPVGTLARDRFGYTLRAFGATVLVALPFPLMLFAIGRALAPAGQAGVVAQVGAGLVGAAVVLGPVLLVRAITREDGLAVVHFLWPKPGCRALRSAILKLGLLLAAFRFCSNFLSPEGTSSTAAAVDAAGFEQVDLRLISRLFLLVTLAGVSVFMALMFRRHGALGAAMWHEPGRPLARFHRVWYPLLVGTPLAVAVLSALGYHYSALQLEGALLWTVWLITAVVLAYALALRWLRLTHRRLMYAELLRKRDAQKAAAAAAQKAAEEKKEAARAARRAGAIEGDDDEEDTDEGEDDAREQLAAIAEQAVEGDAQITPFSLNEKTGKLIKLCCGLALLLGLYLVWSDLLPALEFLNTVKLPLLKQTEAVDGVDVTTPVTLGQLVLCAALLVLTFTTGRHLPGLLDLLVLTRFSVQAGTRYAATMLTQYVIVAAGLLLALSAIGLGWGRLQWLVAALSVGLGFGLQEIFANFVSGLIILFERPIRVGDTVSIGETTGVVTRIRIRATTITDLDLRELIVPNKEFITGQLINWSLSNPVIRLIIPVGIAYGSDTRLAQKLLIQVARKHKDVLNEPAASALFMGFGDNTLDFELRIFVKEVLRRFQILSELNLAIDDAFADAGITIAFPQRDVHLDTLKPLEVVLHREGGASAAPTKRRSEEVRK